MNIGGTELLIIFAVMFVVLGPERTMLYARKIGKWLKIMKVYLSSMTEDLRETVAEPLQQMQEPLKEITKPFEELTHDLTKTVDSVSKPLEEASQGINRSFRDIINAVKNASEVKPSEQNPDREAPQEHPEEILEMAEFVEEVK